MSKLNNEKLILYTQVLVKNKNSEIIRIFDSVMHAAIHMNSSDSNIRKYCSNNINLIRIPYWELEDNVVDIR